MAETDLSKIINLIMENPSLVEQIRNLASESEQESTAAVQKAEEEVKVAASAYTDGADTYKNPQSSRRNELLRAVRPYVSEQRGKAIESMITIADIILAMRQG